MSEKLDEFKKFVKAHPLLKTEVSSKRKTWQELYEDFVLLGEDAFIDDNTLTVNVARLRKKLENVGMEERIKTKKGIGYYLDK